MKRRFLSFLLALTMLLTLAGCATDDKDGAANGETDTKTETEKTNDAGAKAGEEVEKGNFNPEGLPIVDETVTLRVAATKRDTIKKPFDELQVNMDIADATNVTIDWEVTAKPSWRETKNLMIASGDWPDVFFGNYILEDNEIMKLANDGLLLPIEDLIEEFAPNIQAVFDEYPDIKDYITAPDGHIYTLPTINAYQPAAPSAQFINKKWLDDLGLEIPTTTDEFYETLKAFKEYAGEGQTPMSFRFENGPQGINGMFGSFGLVDNVKKTTVVDGRYIYTPAEPEYKDAIIYFHKLIDEGLVDVESFSQDVSVYKSKIKNGDVGVCAMWSLSWVFGSSYEESDYVFLPPLAGPNGERGYFTKPAPALGGKGSFAITTTCENPEVAIRWADYMASPEVSFQLSQGVVGEGGQYVMNADGMLESLPTGDLSNDEFRHQDTPGAHSWHMITASYLEGVVPSPSIAEKSSYDKVYLETQTNTMMLPIYVTPEVAARIAEIGSDLGPYSREMTSKWLMNGGIEEEFDDFVEQLYAMGLQEFLDLTQARYDEIYK